MRQRDRGSSKSHKDIQNHKYRQTERDTQRQRERHKGTQTQRKKDFHLKTTVSLSSEHSLQFLIPQRNIKDSKTERSRDR